VLAQQQQHCVVVGITFTEKWNTDNVLATQVTVEDQLLNGLKLSFDTEFVPQTGYVGDICNIAFEKLVQCTSCLGRSVVTY